MRPSTFRSRRDDSLTTDSEDEGFEYWTTPGGVYGLASDLVVEDYVTVQCCKYDYDNVKHLLDGFTPVDNDLLRPIFTRTFRDSAAARHWWTACVEHFLAGSIALTDDQTLIAFGQSPGAMQQFGAWISYLDGHPDHDGTAAIIRDESGAVEILASS